MRPKSIQLKLILTLASLAMLPWARPAHATVTCTLSSPGFSSAYVPANPATNITASTFTVTCSSVGGPASVTVSYQVAANNGINFLGTQNRAAFGASFVNYAVATDPACAAPWMGTAYIPAPAASFVLAKGATVANTYTYYGCIPPGQTAPPTGTYTDTVTMSFVGGKVSGGGSTFTAGTFPVSIYTPASCTISTPPGNIIFNYTSFGAAAAASTTFATTCTNLLPYTMALDATGGTILGVNYSLALSAASSSGTGLPQTFTISGTVAAGQSGSCAAATCTGSQVRTLTITY